MTSTTCRFRIALTFLLIAGADERLVSNQNCQAADPPDRARPVHKGFEQLTEDLEADRKLREVARAAYRKVFREEFETAKTLSVRERLDRAATVTGELAAAAEKLAEDGVVREFATPGFSTRYAIYPRSSHVLKLFAVRPWLRDYGQYDSNWLSRSFSVFADTLDFRWPTMEHQAELRTLLNDNDPDIRVMATEALATLYDPSDLSKIRSTWQWDWERHRDFVGVPSIPVLSSHLYFGSGGKGGFRRPPSEISQKLRENDPLGYPIFWQQVTRKQYCKNAMRHLCGVDVTDSKNGEWWVTDGETRNSLWYWQYRIHRELRGLELTQGSSPIRLNDRAGRAAAVRKRLRAELSEMDRLVEAKLLLLMPSQHPQLGDREFFRQPWLCRLTKQEVLKLLGGSRSLWSDVNWPRDDKLSAEVDNQLASRIMADVELKFTQQDVPRLQQLLLTTNLKLSPQVRATWQIGISRLLPLCSTPEGTNKETRDGYLRALIQDNNQIRVRDDFLEELVQVGLANQASFLEQLFFQRLPEEDEFSPTQMVILESLGERPRTSVNREFLWKLVLDERFRPQWTDTTRRQARRFKGSRRTGPLQTPRGLAIDAINAHAGHKLITVADHDNLSKSEESSAAFERVVERLKRFTVDDDGQK